MPFPGPLTEEEQLQLALQQQAGPPAPATPPAPDVPPLSMVGMPPGPARYGEAMVHGLSNAAGPLAQKALDWWRGRSNSPDAQVAASADLAPSLAPPPDQLPVPSEAGRGAGGPGSYYRAPKLDMAGFQQLDPNRPAERTRADVDAQLHDTGMKIADAAGSVAAVQSGIQAAEQRRVEALHQAQVEWGAKVKSYDDELNKLKPEDAGASRAKLFATPGRTVQTVFAMILGAVGSGLSGNKGNVGVELMDQAIERDLTAQRALYARTKEKRDRTQTMFELARKNASDDFEAENLVRRAQYEMMLNQITAYGKVADTAEKRASIANAADQLQLRIQEVDANIKAQNGNLKLHAADSAAQSRHWAVEDAVAADKINAASGKLGVTSQQDIRKLRASLDVLDVAKKQFAKATSTGTWMINNMPWFTKVSGLAPDSQEYRSTRASGVAVMGNSIMPAGRFSEEDRKLVEEMIPGGEVSKSVGNKMFANLKSYFAYRLSGYAEADAKKLVDQGHQLAGLDSTDGPSLEGLGAE